MSKPVLDVVIGISTYNDYTLLGCLLQSIRWNSQSFSDAGGTYEIVVCDDGTPDYEVPGEGLRYHSILEKVCAKFGATLIKNGINQGIPATWNHLALAKSFLHSRNIIILNNDLLVAPYWLESMVYFADKNEHFSGANLPFYHIEAGNVENTLQMISQRAAVAVIDPISRQPIGNDRSQPRGQNPGKVMCFAGANFVMRRDRFLDIGVFREDLISFHEESEFSTRAVAYHKWPSYCLPWPNIFHVWGHTFSKNAKALEPSKRMVESRKKYCEIFDVPDEFANNPFAYTDPLFMKDLPVREVKWLLGSSDRSYVDQYTQEQIVPEPTIEEKVAMI